MPEVFISSSSGTSAVAHKLAKGLESRGFGTYLPIRDFAPGAQYPQIAERTFRADAFLVVVGPKPERSVTLEQEWFAILNQASDLTKKLIPIVLGNGEPPNCFMNWEPLHVRDADDSKRWAKLIDTIARALRSTAKPRFTSMPKAALKERDRRLKAIVHRARQLKELGL